MKRSFDHIITTAAERMMDLIVWSFDILVRRVHKREATEKQEQASDKKKRHKKVITGRLFIVHVRRNSFVFAFMMAKQIL